MSSRGHHLPVNTMVSLNNVPEPHRQRIIASLRNRVGSSVLLPSSTASGRNRRPAVVAAAGVGGGAIAMPSLLHSKTSLSTSEPHRCTNNIARSQSLQECQPDQKNWDNAPAESPFAFSSTTVNPIPDNKSVSERRFLDEAFHQPSPNDSTVISTDSKWL